MNRLLKQLIKDHQQIEEILDELEKEVQLCEQDCDKAAELSLILAGLEYIRNYPEIYHHPLEDRLMQQLMQKNIGSGLQQCLTNLLSQHSMLEQQTALLEEGFFSMANGQQVDEAALFSRFNSYCDLQREHLHIENNVLLPAIEHELRPADIAEVRQQYVSNIAAKNSSYESRKSYEQLQKTVINHDWLESELL